MIFKLNLFIEFLGNGNVNSTMLVYIVISQDPFSIMKMVESCMSNILHN